MSNADLDSIDQKLDTLVALLGRLVVGSQLPEDALQKDQIGFLGTLGLGSAEIARIVGTTSNTVNVTLSKLRAKTKEKNKS